MSDEKLDPISFPKPPTSYLIPVKTSPDHPAVQKLVTVDKSDPASIAEWLAYHDASVDAHIAAAIGEARQAGELLHILNTRFGKARAANYSNISPRRARQFMDLHREDWNAKIKRDDAVFVALRSILGLAKKALPSKTTSARGGAPPKSG